MATYGPVDLPSAARQRVLAMTTGGLSGSRRAVLLAILDHLPSPGLHTIQSDICACFDDEELEELANHYILSVFKPIKALGGRTPAPSPSPILSADRQARQHEASLSPSQSRLATTVAERLCLPRDGYRCVITRILSASTPEHVLPQGVTPRQLGKTQTCHIVPLSLAQYENQPVDRLNLSRTWESLCRMFPGLRGRLADNLENINSSSNLFTAITSVHEAFGDFNLAFERQPGQDRYRVHTWRNVAPIIHLLPPDGIVQFIDHSNTNATLPDPYLLETHYIIAQILNASGLAQVLDRMDDDYHHLGFLAADGSTSLPFLIEACS